ncbi:interferon-induced protein 44-like [Lates japonicus]
MGGSSSTPAPPPSPPEPPTPPPPPTFREPWRQVSWGTNERDLQYVKEYQPQVEEVKHQSFALWTSRCWKVQLH